MNSEKLPLMNKELFSNNIDNDEFSVNTAQDDYNDLFNRLKEISRTIALLEKQFSDKF